MLKSAFDYYSLKSSRCRKACGWQMEQKIRTGRKLHQNQFIARESGFYIPATNNEPLKISKASASGHSPSSWWRLIITLSVYYLDLYLRLCNWNLYPDVTANSLLHFSSKNAFFGAFPPLPDCEFWICFSVHHGDNNNVIGYCSYAALYPIKMVSYLIYALLSEIREWASQQLLNTNKNPMWKHVMHHGHMYECGEIRHKPPNILFVCFVLCILFRIHCSVHLVWLFLSRSCQGYGKYSGLEEGMLVGC